MHTSVKVTVNEAYCYTIVLHHNIISCYQYGHHLGCQLHVLVVLINQSVEEEILENSTWNGLSSFTLI